MNPLTHWRPLLRIAARDALRARGRSILTLVMITLPVLGVTAAAVVVATTETTGTEALERRIGSADASVTFVGRDVHQAPDHHAGATWSGRTPPADRSDLAVIGATLGRAVTGIERHEGSAQIRTDSGEAEIMVEEVDLRSPLAEGLHRVVEGRAPETTTEVVVTAALAERGPGIGEQLEAETKTPDGPVGVSLDVVGVIRHGTYRDTAVAVALPDTFPFPRLSRTDYDDGREWLVDAGGDVTWQEVRALNEVGALVVSRAVLEDPPPASAIPADVRAFDDGLDETMLAVIVLVVVMALIEVVLLAGPAFAVGARRQQRTLALLAASGGTPRQMRQVILASGIVLGSVAAVAGVVLGLLVGRLVLPVVQRFSGQWLGPYDVPWLPVVGVAVFGLVSAVLAAVVPALLASRQDVVAVLAGRRGDRAPSPKSPVLGLLLFGAGVAAAVAGTRVATYGEFWIAISAILCVLGMILLVPLVLAGAAALARGLPLPMRYAVRDAARHRTRTVPAVAAVAATVAGVVTLGIAAASDEAENRASYSPMLPDGDGVVTAYGIDADNRDKVWDSLNATVAAHTDAATPLVGIPDEDGAGSFTDLAVRTGEGRLYGSWATTYGAEALVTDRMPQVDFPGVSEEDLAAADRVLAEGGAVLFADVRQDVDEARLRVVTHQPSGGPDGTTRSPWVEVPATVLTLQGTAPTSAVLSPEAVSLLGVTPVQTAIAIDGPVDRATERDIDEAVSAERRSAGIYVERGYESDDEYVIVLLVLAGLGAVLMLGGTLTATFLALSDARPDLATLAAVGGAPRTRRAVAASYALVVGGVGALLGAAVGMVPGVAVSWPLTSSGGSVVIEGSGSFSGPIPDAVGPFLDIPWLMILGLVVLLPLLTASVVGLSTRSRLPLVARLD